MSNEEAKSERQSDNMEQVEVKVKVEEAIINMGCIKKELDDEEAEFDENRYKIALTFENIFGESSREQEDNKDSLIGFLDDEVIMETGTIKLEDIKEEKDLLQKMIVQSHCNKCGGKYEGYCPDCSSLSYILNNLTPNIKPEAILNTMPINTLQIREVSSRQAVFSLKTLPKGIIIGPFDGVTPIQSTTGLQWKIKDKKLVNEQNGNWMKYIQSVGNHASKNLDVFQMYGLLYFETSRKIQEGEELLVCYREEKDEALKSEKEEEFYLTPVKKEEYPKVFACTHCCLGFRLEGCLVEHKSKCPQGDHGDSSEDCEITQCPCCKVWLDKQEHLESHMQHCLENYTRLCERLPDRLRTSTDEGGEIYGIDEIWTKIDVDASYSTATEIKHTKLSYGLDCKTHIKRHYHEQDEQVTHSNTSEKEKEFTCPKCSYQTNHRSHFNQHVDTHDDLKPFQRDVYKKKFSNKPHMKWHSENKDLDTSGKTYECPHCSHRTNYKGNLTRHLSTHSDVKPFQCYICEGKFCQKDSLKVHIKDKHSNTSGKEFKCSECSYQTNYARNFRRHVNTHNGIKPFECDICKTYFTEKSNLKQHIRNKHSNTSEKQYKCFECSYKTNYRGNLQAHLKQHIRNKLSREKQYKCSHCSHRTNYKNNLKRHLSTHSDIKPFQCYICGRSFSQKVSLKVHIRDKHSNTNEKEYKCSECFYQTNYKHCLKEHLNIHSDIKPFQCDICKNTFNRKSNLRVHIRTSHSNASARRNREGDLKVHLDTHTDIKPFVRDICI